MRAAELGACNAEARHKVGDDSRYFLLLYMNLSAIMNSNLAEIRIIRLSHISFAESRSRKVGQLNLILGCHLKGRSLGSNRSVSQLIYGLRM